MIRALRASGRRIASLFHRARVERDFDEELASHLQMHVDENLRAGMTPGEARRVALLALGGMAATRERARDIRGFPRLEALARDLRYGVRRLRRSPGFTAAAVLMLALGIGANAAIFSLVDSVLLRMLPVQRPTELVTIRTVQPRLGVNQSFSYPMYEDLRDGNDVFSGVIARGGVKVNLTSGGATERVAADLVSGNYYDVLGVRPWIGRLFTWRDDRVPGGHPVVVFTYGFWQRRFGADPSIVGRTVLLNEHPMTVIGVASPGFYGLDLSASPDVQIPLMETPVIEPASVIDQVPGSRLGSRRHQWLTLMARRRPGVTVAAAEASLSALFQRIREREVDALPPGVSAFDRREFLSWRIRLLPGAQGLGRLQRDMRTPLLLLFGATAVVLLILAANLANLLLARAAACRAETAMRVALGASRGRIVQQWLAESALVSLAGAAAGVAVAWWGRQALVGYLPDAARLNLDAPLDWRVLGFLLAVGAAAGAAFGAGPALEAARAEPSPAFKEQLRTSSGRTRGVLVAVQVALSVPLLAAALLFARSLANVRSVDLGFSSDCVLVASINPSLNGYSLERSRTFDSDLLAGVRALPGVRGAALATDSPISGGRDSMDLVIEGYHPRDGEDVASNASSVSPGYFSTLGIPIVAGRDFTERDGPGAPRVAIINETMARYYFGGGNPLGRHIGTEKVPDTEIVGIVKDAKDVDVREAPKRHFYEPIGQLPLVLDLTLHVRTAGDPVDAAALVRGVVSGLDPHLPLYNVRTLAQQIDESLIESRLLAWLSAAFGVLATLVAAVGLYGVVACSVARRTREIGVRVALGAPRWSIVLSVARDTFGWIACGLAAGLAAALAAARLVASQLYGVTAADPFVFAAACGALAAAAAVAAYVPARRATAIDPIAALRAE